MNLRTIITDIQNCRLQDSNDALQAIAESEKYFQQAYEGRYLFELIQNVRDANKEQHTNGSVFISLTDMTLSVANTGAPFGEKGINSITTIGKSPKNSQDFIGFKGIGFKSVLEVTHQPRIITTEGSLSFDRSQTLALLKGRPLAEHEIPLFFIPHYADEQLTIEEAAAGIVTRIVLPLRPGLDPQKIIDRFQEIGVHQLILLGCLETVSFQTAHHSFQFHIKSNTTTGQVVVQTNQNTHHFRQFHPSSQLPIPEDVINVLEDKERQLYEKSPFAELILVFDTDEQRQFRHIPDSKLYLFNPLKINSGFSFLIHSYFLVDPARTTLRDSPLNIFLLEQIADYLSGEWLEKVKASDANTFLDLLVFERNKGVPLLNRLYDRLCQNLTTKCFIHDQHTHNFYNLDEIIIADGFDLGLFAEHLFQGKRLIYIKNTITRDWLLKELSATYLTYEMIAAHIEVECEKHRAARNIDFFQHLYQYATTYPDLNLSDRKVLLTRNWELFSSASDVFYGMTQQTHVIFPPSIQTRIHFIHPHIKIPEQRQGKTQTGYVEYSTELLVRRLLKLYEDETVPKMDILVTLLQLKISEKLLPLIRQSVWLPVRSHLSWVRAFERPVYYPHPTLENLYPVEKFIDLHELESRFTEINWLKEKLLQFGAWEIPAIYFVDQPLFIYPGDSRFEFLKQLSYLSPTSFELSGDWRLDLPKHFTPWVTETILQCYRGYFQLVNEEDNPKISYKSNYSYKREMPKSEGIKCFSFLQFLQHQPWIRLLEEGYLLSARDVVGIDPVEYIQPQTNSLRKFLNMLPINFKSNEDFIRLVGLCHWDGRSLPIFQQLFELVYHRHTTLEVNMKEFVGFYNRLLSKLFDFYAHFLEKKEQITALQTTPWLAIDEQSQQLVWSVAQNIYYVEDKPAYEILPTTIKTLLQPQFTNRDKNRFGQIAKRLGKDIRKTITQQLQPVHVIYESPAQQWFPFFPASLALVEILLEIDLAPYLDDLKSAVVKVCHSLTIDLYEKGRHLGVVNDMSHKVISSDIYVVYVTKPPISNRSYFYASILHDLLVELLERDLHHVKLTLNDFFSRLDPDQFILRYEVSAERVEEIAGKLADFEHSAEQLFWIDILNVTGKQVKEEYFINHSINYPTLAEELGLPLSVINTFSLSYESLNHCSNINGLIALFAHLGIRLEDFNAVAFTTLDFTPCYRRQFTSLLFQHKAEVRYLVHRQLLPMDIDAKSRFQHLMDSYQNMVALFECPCLALDLEEEFSRSLHALFPDLHFPSASPWKDAAGQIEQLYRKNQITFKSAVKPSTADMDFYHEFLSHLKHKSLLYFEGTLEKLQELYWQQHRAQLPAESAGPEDPYNLSQYSNAPGLAIESATTSQLDALPSLNGKSRSPGNRRLDGSLQPPVLAKIGIVSEKMVFDLLCQQFQQVEWVSANAAKAGFNPEGSDEHGYDLSYLSADKVLHYVEVKGKMSDQHHFYISYAEVRVALLEKENYHLYFVPYALDNEKRRIYDLGNLFLLEEPYDLFNNARFTATFDTLEINFK